MRLQDEAHEGQGLLFEETARDKTAILDEALRNAEENQEAAALQESVSSSFFERLNSKGRVDPTIPVNASTFNAFLAITGPEGTMTYLKKRKKYLNAPNRKGQFEAERARIDHYIGQLKEAFDEELRTGTRTNITRRDLRTAFFEGKKEGRNQGRSKEREIQLERRRKAEDKIRARQAERRYGQAQRLKDKHAQDRARQAERQYEQVQRLKDQHTQDSQALREARWRTKQQEKQIQRLEDQHAQDSRALGQAEWEVAQQEKQRAEDRAHYQERLAEIQQTLRQKNQEKLGKKAAQHKKKIDALQARIDRLKTTQRQMNDQRQIRRIVKRITGMKKSKAISWERLQEINGIIDTLDFDRSRKGSERRELLRDFLNMQNNEGKQYTQDFISEFAEENSITPEEIDEFTGKVHLYDMTLAEVRDLFEKIKRVYDIGRREFEVWKREKQDRRQGMKDTLITALLQSGRKSPKPRTPKEHSDLVHEYSGGKAGETLARYWDASKTPGRFLADLGEPFRRMLGDDFNAAIGKMTVHVDARTDKVLSSLQKLGLSTRDFFKHAITVNGEDFSWQQVMEIYAGMKNEFSRRAILYGNFMSNSAERGTRYLTEDSAMNAINQILAFINQPENERYRQATEIIMQDFAENFDRINEAQVRHFNRGMERQEAYSPIFRLRHQTSGGFTINAETEEMVNSSPYSEVLQRVADGYTQRRAVINPDKQEPISLNFFENWHKAMIQQERNAALGGLAADVFVALTQKGGEFGSVKEAVEKLAGSHAWEYLRNIYNSSITDRYLTESDASSAIATWLMQNRSYAYVAFSPATMLAQTTSYFLALSSSSKGHIFRSLARFIGMASTGRLNEFFENVYQLYPELRHSGGDPTANEILQEKRYSSAPGLFGETAKNVANLFRQFNDRWAYAGVQAFDRATKAIVFHAAYSANIEKGMSQEEAVRLAIRVVQDTQPASTAREMTEINRSSRSFHKLMFTQFMNALAPVFNVGVVDVVRSIVHPSVNAIKNAAFSLLGFALAAGFTGLVKDGMSGRLPTGEERPDGSDDNWGNWLKETEIDNFLNTFPLINSILTSLYRKYSGRKGYRNNDMFAEPFDTAYNAMRKIYSDDEEEERSMGYDGLMKAAALAGFPPMPYSALKQMMRLFGVGQKE